MNDKISVLIPGYIEKEALNLCIQSCIEGCFNLNNIEIIVGIDGTYDILYPILEKWKKYIKVFNPERHIGLSSMTNHLVYNAKYDKILLVNDDNVFQNNWDIELNKLDTTNTVWSPNQIEPYPSMFPQFIIQDLGRNPQTFNMDLFYQYIIDMKRWEPTLFPKEDVTGSTLPIFMNKLDFIKVGGWNENYPGPYVVDWDFFMKCQMNGFEMKRTYNVHFYHFVSLSTNNTPEKQEKRRKNEVECHEYAKYVWGNYIQHCPLTNKKYLQQ